MAALTPYSGVITRQQAVHLLQRATLGATKTEIDNLVGMSASAAVDAIYAQSAPTPPEPIDPATGNSFVHREEFTSGTQSFILQAYMKTWWIKQMFESSNSALEKMVVFMHTHFTNNADKVGLSFPLYHQNALFRYYALGNFKTLATKVCRDYAMNVFLDSWTNTVVEPNENFGREFMELYTIGKGEQIGQGNYTTYTEDDVREAARVLTGYFPSGMVTDAKMQQYGLSIDTDSVTGLYKASILPPSHDALDKQFSSAFQNTIISTGLNTVGNIEIELNDFVTMIFNQTATAENMCRKLYRFFVYYDITPDIETNIIQPLAVTMMNNNYELLPVLKQLLKSEHFFDTDDAISSNNNKGAIIKSPVEMFSGAMRYFNIDAGDNNNLEIHYAALGVLNWYIDLLDMKLFQPPEVAGYPAYHQAPYYNRNWLSATTLVNRYRGFSYLVYGIPVSGGVFTIKLDSVDFTENSGNFTNPGDPNNIVDTLVNDLFPYGIDATKKAALKEILTDGDPDSYWTSAWLTYTGGGSENIVRFRLDALYNSILQSPEYQLS